MRANESGPPKDRQAIGDPGQASGPEAAEARASPACRPAGPFERFLGWCVHAYTALGLVAAGLIAVLLVQGGPSSFRWSFPADGGRDNRRFDRRLSGAQGADQGGRSRASTAGGSMISSTSSTTRSFPCS